MTSPQATTTDSVPAVIASTGIEDNLPLNLTLTAAEQQNPDNAKPNTSAEPEPQDKTTSPKGNNDSELAAENAGDERSNMEMYREPEHAAIHEDGAAITALIPPDLPAVSMPMAMDGLTGMDALNALLATAGQTGDYDDFINSMQLAPVSMEDMQALPMAMDESMVPPPAYLDPSPYIREHDETRISAYAKLEFDDGEFYMNTYSVILGRDLAAARSALREAEENERRRLEEEAGAREPKTPVRIRREESRYSKSVVSESGGILREGDDTPPEERERRRKLRKSNKASKASKKSKSTGSSSHRQSRRNSLAQPNVLATYQAQPQTRRLEPQTAGAAPVDPTSLRPSPHDCPLVGIHPPAAAARDFKSISREHVKIAYNSRKHLFEAEILGRNGAFVDDVYYGHKNVIPLKSGSQLQIGGVVVRFVLPDVAIGETGAENRLDYEDNPVSERYSEGGKEMSFDFEDAPRQRLLEDTSDDLSDDGRHGHNGDEPDDGEEIGEEVDEDEEEEDIEDRDQSQQLDDGEDQLAERNLESQPQESPKSQKKRGPGRPPKNGIMSKREQQLAKKEALAQAHGQGQQKASKTLPQAPGQPPQPVKNKVGRPRKHPLPENPEIPREKRKYTKRKPKEPKEEDVKQEGSGDDRPTEKKDKKAPKPPRSPSPVFNREDYTEEQLAKPQGNYVNLIYEVLSNSTAEGMSLPQIYRALLRKYPYYHTCSTTGWQSSVRHNLGQHEAFKKVQRDGKGWLWAINEGVSIEKEKKRKSPPPPQIPPGHTHHQPIYQAGHPPHMYPGNPYGPGVMGPPPGYPMHHPMQHNVHPGHPQYMGPPPHMNGHPYPPGPYPPMNGQHPPPPGPIPAIPPQLAASVGPQQYSSPYAPKPPQSATPQPQQQSNDQSSPQEQKPPTPAPPPAPTPHEQPQQPQVTQARSGRPVHNEKVMRAVKSFKTNLGNGLRAKSSNADAVMDSAVNRVLGFTNQSTVPGDPHEDMIMRALQSMLSKIEGSTIKAPPEPSSSNPQSDQRQSQPPQANQNATQPTASQQHNPQQPSKSTGHEAPSTKPTTTPTPTVMRPSFFGQAQNRPNASSVPRPPMMNPGIKRTNSGSPPTNAAPTRTSGPSSTSPAPMIPPTPSSSANGTSSSNGNGASATPANVSVDENGQNGDQMAGQKRPHEDSVADNMREFKRMSTSSGPLQLKT